MQSCFIIFFSIFKFVTMKTSGQLDLASSSSSNNKLLKAQNNSQLSENKNKPIFQQIIKQEKIKERQKVKLKQQQKSQIHRKQQKNKLKKQIKRKKEELEHLSHIQQEEKVKRAFEMANQKDQKDMKKLKQKQEQRKYDEIASKNRFNQALQKMKIQKQINNQQKRLAQKRRKTAQQEQKIQRIRANEFVTFQKDKQHQKSENTLKLMIKTCNETKFALNRKGLAKTVDMKGIKKQKQQLVIKNEEQVFNANALAQVEYKKQEAQNQKRKNDSAQINKKREMRGKEALNRIHAQEQYKQYYNLTKKQQIQYNKERLQAGKRIQNVGLKPVTLAQMQANKKIRAQEQFYDLFIKGRQLVDNEATKYQIFEHQMKDQLPKPSKTIQFKKQVINYNERQSLVPELSNAKYSFEEKSINTNQQIDQYPFQIINQQVQYKKKKQAKDEVGFPNIVSEYGKTKMAETRLNESKQDLAGSRQELNYSQSNKESNF